MDGGSGARGWDHRRRVRPERGGAVDSVDQNALNSADPCVGGPSAVARFLARRGSVGGQVSRIYWRTTGSAGVGQAIDGTSVMRARRAEVSGWLGVGRSCVSSVMTGPGWV